MCKSFKFGVAGVTLGVLSIGYTVFVNIKAHKTQKDVKRVIGILEKSIDGIAKDISVDISQDIVNAAVDRAVTRETERVARNISSEASTYLRTNINSSVKDEIDSAHTKVNKAVSDAVARQVANLDIKKLEAEVKEKAKEMVLEKFDNNLDFLLQDFNQNLSNVSKIYSSIAEKMTKQETDKVFKISL